MSATSQLEAVYAVIQLDAWRRSIVMAYRPTIDVLVAEIRERAPDQAGRDRLLVLVRWLRAEVIAMADLLLDLRRQLGTDPADLPAADDDDVVNELNRIIRTYDRDPWHDGGAL